MRPYYDDGQVCIYHADCRDVLPMLDPVDLVLTDPPYGIDFDYGTGYDDSPDGYGDWLWSVIEMAERKLPPSGYVVCFQAAKNAKQWATWFPREWRLFALPKKFVQIYPTDLQWSTDYALFWTTGDRLKPREWAPKPARDWFVSNTTLMGRDNNLAGHPCPRPIDTVVYLVSCFCPPDGIILDPFMGSGTTLRAAKDLGRRAIGIEIEERYCEIAARRMQQSVLPLEIA